MRRLGWGVGWGWEEPVVTVPGDTIMSVVSGTKSSSARIMEQYNNPKADQASRSAGQTHSSRSWCESGQSE